MVVLSSLAGAGWQFFDNNGVPLAGGKLYTYAAGTTTPQTTYTSSSGTVPHANPIILDSAGRVSEEIWLTEAVSYKFVLATSTDITIWTKDNIEGSVSFSSEIPSSNVTFTGFNGQTGFVSDLAGDDGSDWIGFLADGAFAVARSAQDKLRETLSVKDFGAAGDGVTDDTAAIQAALNEAASDPLSIKSVFIPSGIYKVGKLILPVGINLYGEGGRSVSTAYANTRLVQSADDDVFIFDAFQNGSLWYWFGHVSDLQIIGNSTYTNGYAFNSITSVGNNVNFQDQSVFENLTLRDMPKGGMNFTSGAFPLTVRNVECLWNGGPGITFTRLTVYEGVHLDNISADGNVGGAIKLAQTTSYDSFLITALKSEARVNNSYGGGAGQQRNAIVVVNGGSAALSIMSASHISSIPDGVVYEKPGNFIQITGTSPTVDWSGVSIRVRPTDTGTDPVIIGGVSSVYIPPYTVQNGVFNTDYPFFKSRLILQRDTVTGATPSALNRNIMLVDNSGATTMTDITDGIEGQVLFLAFNNANTTVQNNANIVLNDGADWTPGGNSTLTFIYVGSKWRELARSYGQATGVYSVSNLTIDRSYDANATTVDELADVLGTLLSDLKTRGVI